MGSVVALDPAVAEAEAEKEVLAAAPEAARRCVALDVNLVQLIRIDGEVRLGLHDHVILVELGVHGVDLTLPKGVVEGLVHGGGRDAQP